MEEKSFSECDVSPRSFEPRVISVRPPHPQSSMFAISSSAFPTPRPEVAERKRSHSESSMADNFNHHSIIEDVEIKAVPLARSKISAFKSPSEPKTPLSYDLPEAWQLPFKLPTNPHKIV